MEILKLNYFIPCVCAISVFFISCGADTPPCPTCPAPVVCPPQNQLIQLSQLDAASRERLKSELLAEIKEETKLQWRKELEQAQMVPSKPVEAVPNIAEKPPTEKPLTPSVPEIRPEPLPPTQKIERDERGMKILKHTFATQIVRRLPVDERDVFHISEASVFCYVEIASASEEDRNITIRFTHTTGLAQSYTLPISQSPAWRTWSKLNLTKSMTGTWLCEVFNEDNTLLASRPFVIVDD